MAHEFLSDDWMDAIEALQQEAPEPPAALADLTLNIKVSDCPFGEREIHTTGGKFERLQLAEGAKATLTVPFSVAKSLFIDQDQQAAMQAFMSGQIKVEGDMTALMGMQNAGAPSPEQEAFSQKIKDLTA